MTNPTGRILLVDDDAGLRYSLGKMLRDAGHEVIEARTGEEGLGSVERERPDLVLLDLRMPGMGGLDAVGRMRKLDPKLPVVIMTAYGTTESAILAMQRGAHEYILKPFDPDEVLAIVRAGLESRRLMTRIVAITDGANGVADPAAHDAGDLLVGSSLAMQSVYKAIGQVAGSGMTVLICGESGTGKELVARAIYMHSHRADRPFLAVNCAAIPESLLESELFGHERGAFTGADSRRIGKFEQVSGGTIFLDEVGDMTPGTQAKILRVLQDGIFQRLGGLQEVRVDVRVIAATNRDLPQLIRTGRFREDLYYRLSVFTMSLPPLRERREDIPDLARYFIRRAAGDLGKPVRGAADEVLATLERHDWPGNVRELENAIKRAVLVCRGDILLPGDLALGAVGPEERAVATGVPRSRPTTGPETLDRHVADAVDAWQRGPRSLSLAATVERALLTEALDRCNGNQVQAARLLGIGRHALRLRMERLGIGGRMTGAPAEHSPDDQPPE
jgi:nitrogen regulation protein NR(I)